MWSVPQPPPVAAPASCSSRSDSWIQSSVDSFLKDGRKIRVGDCALFQAGNAPPFIGIIRWFTTSKEDCLKLCVNWLYRPADVKLPKGILLEAAPNELFYSFHKDVISAASLLHSCKVAFLRKGVELPPGISSFVCRRVYDIANKCLWWLTDQDYINEWQEEVDQLLDKTRLEMHAALQSGSRSPKPSNGPTSTQQLKSGTDSVQNSGMSIPSQAKGRKRERGGDHGTDSIKRERPTKLEDGDSASSRLDNMIKVEIPKMTEKGSLATIEDVEKLVQLVQLDKNERKIDLANKILLADVIAATDRIECLGRFVQIRGVPVLDDWLQEAHKGKTGDGCSPKESDKGSEDLLLALLRALDKLPVNLNALQTCNVGKSVNHLRSHKNIEIQKKARSLVDTWKKRVDAEMTMINDAKSGGSNQAATWPVKQGFSEITHAASRRSGSTEATNKASISQTLSACKTLVRKPGHVDAIVKSTPITPGSLKLPSCLLASVSISSMDSPAKGGANSGNSELPLATVKEEKSSGSSQSQNNSQPCFSDHTKTMGSSWKEDAKNSTSGSMNANKIAGSLSRHRRSSNGFSGCSTSGAQKEVNLGRCGKVSSHCGLSSERALDMPSTDHSNSQRLIVRLPNPSRSPARGANGGSIEDPSIPGTRASSPGVPDKYDHTDRKTMLKGDSCPSHVSQEINVWSMQCNDAKEGLVGSDDRAAILDEESRSADETVRAVDACKIACSSGSGKGVSIVESKSRDSHSSMNVLIESCANCSEANTSVSAGEDIGINLLANVAAGEISNLGSVSPSGSPGSSSKEELFSTDNEVKSRLSCEDGIAQNHGQSDQNADFDSLKQGKSVGQLLANDKLQETNVRSSADSKSLSPIEEKKFTSEHTIRHHISNVNSYKTAEYYAKPEVKSEEEQSDKCLSVCTPADKKEGLEAEGANQSGAELNKVEYTCEMIKEGSTKASDLARNSEGDGKSNKLVAVDSSLCASSVNEVSGGAPLANQQQCHAAENHVESADNIGNDDIPSYTADKAPCLEIADERKTQKSDELKDENLDPSHSARKEQSSLAPSCDEHGYEILERKEAFDDRPVLDDHESPSAAPTQESEKCEKSTASKLSGASPDRGEIVSSLETSSAKLDFDLNEGFSGDDANKSEPVTSSVPVCSTAFRLPSHVSSMSSGTHSPITVAAPAKGPFVPPENLLKGKGEPGWKGSAATSAFRPAEPRKVFELPLNTYDIEKQGRPPLDIDLNVPDERVVEDMASQSSQTAGSESGVVTRSAGGLGLDLNKADEGADNGLFLASATSRLEVSLMSVKRLTDGEANILRDFDLNNGPGVDEIGSETLPKSQHTKNSSNMSFLPSIAGLRMGNSELGNVSSWFTPGNSYPAVAIPSFLPDRGDQPFPIIGATGTQRILGSVNGPGTFGCDTYRGPVLSSSPAMAYPPSTAFSYAGFPFSSSFPLTSTSFSSSSTPYVDSTCFPAVLSQFVGPTSAVSSHYPRPYVVSLPEGSNSAGSERSRKWVGQGLDLNAGPGSADADVKDDRRPLASRQLPIGSSQAFVEEQARMYQISGGGMKRKDREGGSWDERFYKQPSWQ